MAVLEWSKQFYFMLIVLPFCSYSCQSSNKTAHLTPCCVGNCLFILQVFIVTLFIWEIGMVSQQSVNQWRQKYIIIYIYTVYLYGCMLIVYLLLGVVLVVVCLFCKISYIYIGRFPIGGVAGDKVTHSASMPCMTPCHPLNERDVYLHEPFWTLII